jgi:NAD-dependent SIR2 family protein deacetylase
VRIGGVDIPWGLIEAQRQDRLVIFVGAGASRSSPSDLPDFRQLAAAIAAESGVTVTSAQLENPDVLLGDLQDQHAVDVHQRVADRIGSVSSQPNRLHEAIAALAVASPQVRIVTTNYDLHLSEALTPLDRSFTQETAPALPLGDDFTGMVYLHGRLGRPVRQLVVTDADFWPGIPSRRMGDPVPGEDVRPIHGFVHWLQPQ